MYIIRSKNSYKLFRKESNSSKDGKKSQAGIKEKNTDVC